MECKQLPETQCRLPHCVYVNTQKRKYCRKANNTKRINPVQVKVQPVRTTMEKQKATRKITQFIKASTKILNIVCGVSGECLSFGKSVEEIKHFFKGFTHFDYVTGPLKSIGGPTANGFIREIEYNRESYSAYAILKSNQSESSDSLVYEYMVGINFINQVAKQFPCFVNTYGLFFYKDMNAYNHIESNPTLPDGKQVLLDSLDLQHTVDYKKACVHAQRAVVLIQHIHNALSLQKTFSIGGHFIKYDMGYVFFIIYQALASMSKVYTHYDLHRENVLLFRPFPDKVIHYVYHGKNGIVQFNCPYVPKIIDYGRCFFDNGGLNSKIIYDKVCSIKECGKCGQDYGFTLMSPTPWNTISVQQKNESHDLRLMTQLDYHLPYVRSNKAKSYYTKGKLCNPLLKMISKIKYGESLTSSNKDFGTLEDTTLHPKGDIVANVTDAYNELKKMITNLKVIEENNKMYPPDTIGGELHIYENGPMEFFRK